MRIYLVRHGRQNSKLCNVDVELAKEGREQAKLVGERLKSYNIEAVYSSDLLRAVETADIINESLQKERIIDERFREANFGALTGLTNQQIQQQYPDFGTERTKMIEDLPYPGGGENCQMVWERVFPAIEEIANGQYKNVCVVTHGGAIRALLTGIVNAPYAHWLSFGRQLENCSITDIMYDKAQGTYHIERINDYAHIEKEDRLLRKHFGNGIYSK